MKEYKSPEDVVFNSFKNDRIAQIGKKDIENYDKYKEIVSEVFNKYIKDADKKTMMVILKKMEKGTQTRAIHQARATQIIKKISEGLNLDSTIGTMAMSYHDLAHGFLGHNSEKMLNEYFNELGYGNMVHNAQAIRTLLYKGRVIDKIQEKMTQQGATKAEKKSVEKVIWAACDIILCHNGETNKYNFVPKRKKSKKELISDTLLCFAIEGYDRDRISATDIGCLAKIVDVISYLGRDIVDGLINGFITKDEVKEKYTECFKKLGITEEQLDACLVNKETYNFLPGLIENNLCEIIINENKGKKGIHISNDIVKTIGTIKTITLENIAQRTVTKKMNDIYNYYLKYICEEGKKILQEERILDDLIITHGCISDKDICKLEDKKVINQNQKEIITSHKKSLMEKYNKTYLKDFIKFCYDTNFRDFYFTVEMTKQNMEQTQKVDSKRIDNLLNGICYNISANYAYSLNDEEMLDLIKKINNEKKIFSKSEIDELSKPYNGVFGDGNGTKELALQRKELSL